MFQNEPYTDFSIPSNREAMEVALAKVRSHLGQAYDLRIAGERFQTTDKLRSVNPSDPSQVIGIHQKASPAMAWSAVESAHEFFAEWGHTDPADRIAMLRRAAQI